MHTSLQKMAVSQLLWVIFFSGTSSIHISRVVPRFSHILCRSIFHVLPRSSTHRLLSYINERNFDYYGPTHPNVDTCDTANQGNSCSWRLDDKSRQISPHRSVTPSFDSFTICFASVSRSKHQETWPMIASEDFLAPLLFSGVLIWKSDETVRLEPSVILPLALASLDSTARCRNRVRRILWAVFNCSETDVSSVRRSLLDFSNSSLLGLAVMDLPNKE